MGLPQARASLPNMDRQDSLGGGSGFQVKVLAVLQTKREELSVGLLPIEVVDDVQSVPTQDGIVAEAMRTEPFHRFISAGNDAFADDLVNPGIFIGQQANQGVLLTFGELGNG